jgi:hypothetical protein
LDRLQPTIRIAITAAAYAAIRESLLVAKSRRYAPQKAVDGLYVVCPIHRGQARRPEQALTLDAFIATSAPRFLMLLA